MPRRCLALMMPWVTVREDMALGIHEHAGPQAFHFAIEFLRHIVGEIKKMLKKGLLVERRERIVRGLTLRHLNMNHRWNGLLGHLHNGRSEIDRALRPATCLGMGHRNAQQQKQPGQADEHTNEPYPTMCSVVDEHNGLLLVCPGTRDPCMRTERPAAPLRPAT